MFEDLKRKKNMFDSFPGSFGSPPESDEDFLYESSYDEAESLKDSSEESKLAKLLEKGVLAYIDYKTKSLIIGAITGFTVIYIISLCFAVLSHVTGPFRTAVSFSPVRTLEDTFGYSDIAGIFCIFVGIAAGVFAGFKYVNYATSVDRRKIKRSRNDTFGSADWLNYDSKTMNHIFNISPTDFPDGTPLGKIGDKALCMPQNPTFDQFSNKNMVIIGGSGSGKSFSGINPMVATRIAYGESFVVSDTKGALYNDTAKLAKRKGYKVWVLNLKNLMASDGWDLMREIVNAREEEVHEMIDIYVNIIMENTKDPNGKSDKFWSDNEGNLLRALLFYIGRSTYYRGDRNVKELTRLLNGPIKELDKLLGEDPPEGVEPDATYMAYQNIKNMTSEELKDKFRSGLATRLNTFLNPNMASILSSDDIHFEDMAGGNCAIYLVTHDSNSAYDFITALFVTCLYNRLNAIAESSGFGGSLKPDVWLILDEFANMSYVPDFSRKISTSRSKHINIVFAIQALEQLKERYKGHENTILGQCATMLFYGSSDEETKKFISDKTGTMTIVSEDRAISKPIYNKLYIPVEERVRTSDQKRNLLTPDEVGTLSRDEKQCLIFINQKGVVKASTYTQEDHPLWKGTVPEDHNLHVPIWVKEKYGDGYSPITDGGYTPVDLDNSVPDYSINTKNSVAALIYRKNERGVFGEYESRAGTGPAEVPLSVCEEKQDAITESLQQTETPPETNMSNMPIGGNNNPTSGTVNINTHKNLEFTPLEYDPDEEY